MEQVFAALAAAALAVQAWALAVRTTADALTAVAKASFQLVRIATLAPFYSGRHALAWVAPSRRLGGVARQLVEPPASFHEAELPFYRLPSAPMDAAQPALDQGGERELLLPKGDPARLCPWPPLRPRRVFLVDFLPNFS
jgi:hypothetical protein